MKAADLDDLVTLSAVALDAKERGSTLGACTWTLAERSFPQVPQKVVAAKLRQLMKRGLLTGCSCGCRGDWLLTDAGRDMLV